MLKFCIPESHKRAHLRPDCINRCHILKVTGPISKTNIETPGIAFTLKEHTHCDTYQAQQNQFYTLPTLYLTKAIRYTRYTLVAI